MGVLVWLMVCSVSLGAPFPWYNPSLPTTERVGSLLKALTVKEKISLMVNHNPAIPRLGLRSYNWRSNEVHGTVDSKRATVFTQSIGMGATFDPPLMRRIGSAISDEQRALNNKVLADDNTTDGIDSHGVDVWGPNINLVRDPRWGRGQETLGECPVLTAQMAIPLVRGLQDLDAHPGLVKVAATLKHWDAYSLDRTPPRLRFDPNISQTDLQLTYFAHWETVVRETNPGSVMCAYNGINGHPMCASPLTQSVLRDLLGFTGYVVSDSGAVNFMVSRFKLYPTVMEASVASLKSGCDLNSGNSYHTLGDALQQKLITEDDIDRGLNRTLTYRVLLGMFDPPATVPYRNISVDVIDSTAHRDLAREVAVSSVVMLRNEKQTLPLTKETKTIAVIGPNADSKFALMGNYGSCYIDNDKGFNPNCTLVTHWVGIRDAATTRGVTVKYAQGMPVVNSHNKSGFAEAVQIAKDADVTIMVMGYVTCDGGNKGAADCIESEGRDRTSLGLPGVQEDLIKAVHATGTPVVLVLCSGSGISVPWAAQNVHSILQVWYAGEEGGNALGDVIFGVHSPAGRLPVTVYQSVDQLPADTVMQMSAHPGRTYRYFTQTPLYAFGFGMTYGDVTYSNPTVTPSSVKNDLGAIVNVCVQMAMTNGYKGDEVMQVYASWETPPLGSWNPHRQLLAFTRVHELGSEATSHCLPVSIRFLRLVDTKGDHRLIPGIYSLCVGGRAPGSPGLYVTGGPHPPVCTSLTITA